MSVGGRGVGDAGVSSVVRFQGVPSDAVGGGGVTVNTNPDILAGWVLETGVWNDDTFWDDDAFWRDSP